MLPYGRQTIEEDDIEAVSEALKSDFLTTGPRVKEFEDELCKVTGAKFAIAVSNGTVAPHLACIAAGLKAGDCAIVPSMTFLATANAVRYCNADVIFSDVNPDTGLMTADTLLEAIGRAKKSGKNLKAVLPVHLTGQTVNLKSVRKIADKNDLTIIADSCHALGTRYDNNPIGCGQYEDFSTFSFHPVKTIAMGEGGAVTTNNKDAAERIRTLRHHGMIPTPEKGSWTYEMRELGYNYRLTDIQCALGISQLKKLQRFLSRRAEIVTLYDELFKNSAPVIKTPERASKEFIGWHLYALRIDFKAVGTTRQNLMAALKEKGIGTQVHYIPVHSQPYYQELYGALDLPGTTEYYEKTLSIPLYPTLTDHDACYVAQTVISILGL